MPPLNIYNFSVDLYSGGSLDLFQGYFSASQQSIVTTGLTHWFDAGNSSSYAGTGTTWTNLVSGNSNMALVNGPVFVPSGSASFFRFDGVNDYMTGSGFVFSTTTKATTVSYVLSVHNLSGQTDRIWVAGGDPMQLELGGYTAGGNITWSDFTVGSVNFFADIVPFASPAPTLMTAGQTYMVTFVSDVTKVSLYINGTFVSSSTEFLDIANHTNGDINIFYQTGTVRSGSISHLLIYSSSLSQAQVTQNYNALKSRYGLP